MSTLDVYGYKLPDAGGTGASGATGGTGATGETGHNQLPLY